MTQPSPGQGQEWRSGPLRLTWYVLLAVLALLTPLAIASGRRITPALVASLPICLLGLSLSRRPERYRPAGLLLLALVFSLAVLSVALAGPGAPVALAWSLVIVMSGALFGGRGPWVATGMVALASAALGAAHLRGLLPPYDPAVVVRWGDRGVLLRMVAFLVALIGLLCGPVAALLRRFEAGLDEDDRTLALLQQERAEKVRAAESRRQAEAALVRAQKVQLVGALGVAAAHDFNNALALVQGAAELLRGQASEEERREAAEAILAAAARATSLSRKLVALARPEAGGAGIADLDACFAELARTCAQILPADVRFSCRAPPGLRARIGEAQLEQVLLNLVLNAREAMPAGGPLELEAEAVPPLPGAPPGDAGWVEVRVRDGGAGIAPEVRARLFEPFFTTRPQGAGLGLASSLRIVHGADGRLEVRARPGEPTTVVLTLPRAPVDDPARAGPQAAARRVLLVEPDESVLRVAGIAVRARGFAVLEQADAGGALELVRRQRERLDLLCLGEEEGDLGTQALVEEFCALHGGARVLVCSSSVAPAARHPRVAAERLSLLAKPYSAAELARRVALLLGPREGEP